MSDMHICQCNSCTDERIAESRRIDALTAERIHFEAVAMTAIDENEELEAEVGRLQQAIITWYTASSSDADSTEQMLGDIAEKLLEASDG